MPSRLGPAKPRGSTWKGGREIPSHARQVNFSRTYCSTFHCRGTTSSVSVTSSPSLASRVDPQQLQAVGTGNEDPFAGKVLGEGLAEGFLRNGRTVRRPAGSEFVLGRRRDEIRELELHLVEEAGPALAPLLAIKLAPRIFSMASRRCAIIASALVSRASD